MAAFDLAIIGGGPAGYVAGVRAAQLGGRCVVVERDELGGTCLNWGCIPSKSLIAAAEVFRSVKRAERYGIEIPGGARADLAAMVARKDGIVAGLVKGIGALFRAHGVRHVAGEAEISAPGEILVRRRDGAREEISARKIIIATGSRPAQIPALPIDGERVISSEQAVHMKRLPARLLIVGAGVIGCEFACLYRELGAEVALVEALDRVLPLGDEDVSRLMERELKKQKINARLGERIARVSREGGELVAALEGGGEIRADTILVSIGRTMNTAGLGLERIGVRLGERGEIQVSERMETSAPGVYAAGDVTGDPMLAHVASAEGVAAAENAMGGEARMDYRAIPAGIFTHPEIGVVGMTEREAAEAGREARVGRFPMRALGKAQAERAIEGEAKIIADAGDDAILGVHVVGARAAEVVHEAAVAMRNGLTASALARTIHAHPTLSEALMEAAHDLHGAAIHAPPRKTRR